MTAPNDKRSMPYGGAFAIQDTEIIDFIKSIDLNTALWEDDVVDRFCENYLQWIQNTKNNSIIGLENFKHAVYSNGTSQTFDMFYIKNKDRRFRCFQGEYIYHQIAWRNNWPNWKFLEQEDLVENDAVVVSLPFSNTGNCPESLDSLYKKCDSLNIPVLVDCAYFGICSNLKFDFCHPCITDIVFSLSKTFPVAHARIGMRLTRTDEDDLMSVYSKINYNNRIGAKLGSALIEKYDCDYVYNKYRSQQIDLCQKLDVIASNTVLFGLDYHDEYPEYHRGGNVNRLGLHKHYDI